MVELDVRAIPTWERHPRIFAAYDALRTDETLTLISDHEPRPLRAEFERKRAGGFTWVQRQLGDGRWEVRLTRCDLVGVSAGVASSLARCSVFAGLDARALDDLASRTRRVVIKRSHCVVDQAVNWPYVGIVERGVVQAVLGTVSGREQALYDVLAHDLFGEISLFDRGLTPVRFIALTNETVVLLVPADDVRGYAARERSVASALEQAASQHCRAILEDLAATLSRSTVARVAQVLLSFASPGPGLEEALDPLRELTQVDLALRAGTVKEVVSRALGELEELGAVARSGGRIVRLDRGKLADIAESSKQPS